MLFLPTSSTTYERPPDPLTPKEYAQKMVTERWDSSQWKHFDDLIGRESGWGVYEHHYPQSKKSSAMGLCGFLNQAWEDTGFIKTNNPYVQVDACIVYIQQKYKTPERALSFHKLKGWF